MSGSGKKLTTPPKNLKEAIYWVLRVSELRQIDQLAAALVKLLDKDAGEVARGVLGVMGKSITDLAYKLGQVEEVSAWGDNVQRKPFKVLVSYLQTFKGNLEHVRDYGSRVSEEQLGKLKAWLTGQPSGPIGKLADGLKTFVNTNYGIFQNPYASKYDKNQATWPTQPSEKETCALIFVGIAPMLFYVLTYLYWQCAEDGKWKELQNESNGSSSGKSDLKRFFDSIGYNDCKVNDSKKRGSDIATVLKSAFAELENHVKLAYPKYLGALFEKTCSESSLPLSCCHLIASPLFTPNPPHRVHSSSPAAPSFLGYSGLTALAGGAYGFNLGGLGTFVSGLLA
ncbi:variant erythrocyte surface antigen-1 family protein [Babesia caballi]|uniref:Variant erythrocyte surface antigen-1 family protein n=1 Tax=Babesia caballi TaxID=5871 RepID=A0AAV4LUD4_BABCB|nr:variant erythrocyte surface antigen-1 family protein [Babesia caballi]